MSEHRKTAMEAASAYLANRMRTVSEMRHYLRERGYDDTEAEEAIGELTDLGYLDDYLYAERYYEYNREKRRGIKRAARELADRGVDETTIKNAGEDFLYANNVDEYKDALYIAIREAEGSEVDDKLIARIARKLEAKGYDGSDIIKVLSAIRKSEDWT